MLFLSRCILALWHAASAFGEPVVTRVFSVEHSCIAGALRWTVWLCYNYYTFLIMQLVSNSHRGQNYVLHGDVPVFLWAVLLTTIVEGHTSPLSRITRVALSCNQFNLSHLHQMQIKCCWQNSLLILAHMSSLINRLGPSFCNEWGKNTIPSCHYLHDITSFSTWTDKQGTYM